MADIDDSAKAEKLAAAKKRFEELKKKGSKKASKKPGKAAASSSKVEKSVEESVTEEPTKAESPIPEEKLEDTPEEDKKTPVSIEAQPLSAPSPTSSPAPTQARNAAAHARRTSSSGFRRPSISATDILRSGNKSPLSPTDVPDIYRRQAETISGLTEENEKLVADVGRLQSKEKRVTELEAEKDELLEQLSDIKEEVRGLKDRIHGAEEAKKTSEDALYGAAFIEIKKLKSEVAALNRQISHLTSQVSAKDKTISELRLRSSSTSGSDDKESLTAKEDQIESMEMEISRIRNELERCQKASNSLESSLKSKQIVCDELQEEISKTQNSLEAAQAKLVEELEQRSSVETQIQDLRNELDALRTEDRKKDSSIASLEKDYNTLKTLYRDAEAKYQESSRLSNAKARESQELEDELAEQRRKAGQMEAENEDLKLKLERALLENRKLTGANPEDDREVDELEDAERQRLREKVHSLEKALDSERRHGRHQRTESMRSAGGFLDDDDVDFGELMKREMEVARAREEENRQKIIDAEAHKQRMEQERIERIREVKRGLEKWRGWRMDLTLVGGSAVGLGEMFEV